MSRSPASVVAGLGLRPGPRAVQLPAFISDSNGIKNADEAQFSRRGPLDTLALCPSPVLGTRTPRPRGVLQWVVFTQWLRCRASPDPRRVLGTPGLFWVLPT